MSMNSGSENLKKIKLGLLRKSKDLFHPCAFDIKRWKRAHLTPQSGLSVLEVISELIGLIRFLSPARSRFLKEDPSLLERARALIPPF